MLPGLELDGPRWRDMGEVDGRGAPNDGELYRGPCCLDHAVGLHVCEDVGGLAADGDDVVTGVEVALSWTAWCDLFDG